MTGWTGRFETNVERPLFSNTDCTIAGVLKLSKCGKLPQLKICLITCFHEAPRIEHQLKTVYYFLRHLDLAVPVPWETPFGHKQFILLNTCQPRKALRKSYLQRSFNRLMISLEWDGNFTSLSEDISPDPMYKLPKNWTNSSEAFGYIMCLRSDMYRHAHIHNCRNASSCW